MDLNDPEVQLIYLAGIVDGEGHIRISDNTRRRGNKTYTWPTKRIVVANTNKELMEWLIDNFGGAYHSRPKPYEHYQQGYAWEITGENAVMLGNRLKPYLIVKKEQLKRIIDDD